MSRYSQPQRAFRRKAEMMQLSRECQSFYGDGAAMLGRISEYLDRERVRAGLCGDRVRLASLQGAQSVLRGAARRVATEESICPF